MASFKLGNLIQKLRVIPGIKEVLHKAVLLYAVFEDKQSPKWVKTTVVVALAYLVNPVDAIPDAIPILGYTDDIAALLAALATVKSHITSNHHQRAQQILEKV